MNQDLIVDIDPSGISSPRQKSIFIWIDILGFSERVEDEKSYPELLKLLENFSNNFKAKNSNYVSDIISDGLILRIDNPSYEKFKDVITELRLKQFEFVCQEKVFIRGGIAVGSYKQEPGKSYIGNGLARAVNLEGNYVCWPIIGTNRINLQELRNILKQTNDNELFDLMLGFNNKGEDIYFVDFIEDNIQYLQLIIQKIKEFTDDPKKKRKYIWLLKYYEHKYGNVDLPNEFKECIL